MKPVYHLDSLTRSHLRMPPHRKKLEYQRKREAYNDMGLGPTAVGRSNLWERSLWIMSVREEAAADPHRLTWRVGETWSEWMLWPGQTCRSVAEPQWLDKGPWDRTANFHHCIRHNNNFITEHMNLNFPLHECNADLNLFNLFTGNVRTNFWTLQGIMTTPW